MCSIVGFINKKENSDVLKKMLAVQNYRGPNDSGVFFDNKSGVHLGHNRLSIQDLSEQGHQPFVSDCKNYVIAFNGEVYNFKKIREELENLGYKFISHSDTEVILYSYKEWGINAVHKFIGMFAFAILDKTKNKLFLVRDRAGVKPLYYYNAGNEFLFSSELKSFHEYPHFRKELDADVLPYFFQFGYIPAPHSIFKNCYKLEAGHYLEYDLQTSQRTVVKYWDVNDFYLQEEFDTSEKEILLELESLLDDAINLRMVADVPVGVFLSGGYDSSLVSAILAKTQKIDTFTIGFDDEEYNEAKHAKAIAHHLKTNHHEYYMQEKDMLDLVETLPFFYDEPFGDSSALPTMIVSKMARQNVTVALSADGGDEAFCGYDKYFFLEKFFPIFSNSFKKIFLQTALNITDENFALTINNLLPKSKRQKGIKRKYLKFKRAINSPTKEQMFLNASSYVEPNVIKKFLKVPKDEKIFQKFAEISGADFLDQMMAVDYKTFMADDVLTKVDRATMSVSLEGREPLLDHRIIEFMGRVPKSLKYKNRQGKYLLRQILYKHIPKQLVDKPKSGFAIPLDRWLRGELRDMMEQYLNKSKLDDNIFNIDEVLEQKQKFLNGHENGFVIWFIMMYQMWKEKWFS